MVMSWIWTGIVGISILFAIINGSGGSVQTSDLRVDAGKDLYVTVVSAEDASVAYEKPAE